MLPSKTTIIPPPAITCPTAPSPVTTGNRQSAVVSYSSPAVTGGTAPVSVICTPPSGSTFNVGSTAVTCIATDAVRRTASCSFAVSVILPQPHLGVTTILAFGDSITEGEVPVAGEFRELSIRPMFVEPNNAYPADLTLLLAQRYTAQGASRVDAFTIGAGNMNNICTTDPPRAMTSGIVVINAGCLGEQAGSPATLSRLNDMIVRYHPDVLLLLEGVNDLSSGASIPGAVQSVQRLILAARSLEVRVFVGTLLPEIAGKVNGNAANLIKPFNSLLALVATSAGATVVDLYGDIVTDVTDWISPYDGLHPTEAGYQEMARVWFNSIKNAFELPSTSTVLPHRVGPGRQSRTRYAPMPTGAS
jgi:lysophospholipase L1-like esterase